MVKKSFIFTLFLFGITTGCFAQLTNGRIAACVAPVVSISADYCTTPGKVILTAQPSTGVTYLWNTGAKTQSITVDIAGNYSVAATTISGACQASSAIKVGNELVINGDFSAGNIGFSSGYNYKSDSANYNQELVDDTGNNAYAVGTSGQNYHPAFYGKDHTNNQTGNRNFMLVNGHGSITVWQETVNVEPNTNYYYSAWAMNLNPSSPATLQFEVNGVKIGTIADLNIAPKPTSNAAVALSNWVRFYNSNSTGWNSGSSTTAVIRIVDLNSTANGNDFGLDDISFATLSPFVVGPLQPGTDNQNVCPGTVIQPIQYTIGSGGAPSIAGLPPGISYFFDGITLTISGSSTAFGTYQYTVSTTGCADNKSVSGTIVIKNPAVWNGNADTNWNNITNWPCGIVPAGTSDVIIPSGLTNYPVINSGIGNCRNLTIQTGASVTVIKNGILKIAGNIYNSGKLDASNGTIEMNGSDAQSIAGSLFINKTIRNLIVNNMGSGLSVSSTANDTLKITGLLSFGNASAVLNTGDNLTLVSNSSGTAAVGILGGINSINGNVIVERYINTGTAAGEHPKSWQFLAAATSGQTIKQSWMENGTAANYYGTMISGPGGTAAGFDISSPAPSIKYYNYHTKGWTAVANTSSLIDNVQGYMVFVRGDRTVTGAAQAANPTVLRTKGTLYTGSLASIVVHNNNWGSIGNPYASPIDFTLVSTDAAIDNKFYVLDPYLYGSYGTGGYQTLSAVNNWLPVPGGTSGYPSNVPNSIIQSGQAFFVHATSSDSTGTSNLRFMENCKASNNGSNKFSRMAAFTGISNRQFLRASLITSSGLMADGNVVAFDKAFSNGIDGNDALKMINSGENFGVKLNGQLLAIDAKSPVTANDTISYYTSNLALATYKLIFAPENMQSAGVQAFLIDQFLKTQTPLSLSDSTFINLTVTSAAASSASDRFLVVFRQMAALPVTVTSVTATLKNKNADVKWKVQNESGIQQYQVERSTDGTNFKQVASVNAKNNVTGSYSWTDLHIDAGKYYYRIKIITLDGRISYTQIVKVISGKLPDQIFVYPNPIKDGIIHLQLANHPEGNYGVRLFNSAGQLIISEKLTHAKGTSEETINCPNLAKAIYQLEIVKTDGRVEVIKVMN